MIIIEVVIIGFLAIMVFGIIIVILSCIGGIFEVLGEVFYNWQEKIDKRNAKRKH